MSAAPYAVSASAVLARLRAQGVTVRRLVADSRQVEPGDLFLAYPGTQADGRNYIDAALKRGAAAVLVEVGAGETAPGIVEALLRSDAGPRPCRAEGASEPEAAPDLAVPHLAVNGLAALCGELAAEAYGRPAEKLWMVGITGTNGKTSCSQWLAQALSLLGEKTGVIGTLGNGFYGALVESPNTTPDALVLQRVLVDLVAQGAGACAMEVSSIGIEENRINGVRFDVAVFTNLTQDHLDYHGSMASYAAAKERLFAWPGLQGAVINLDDAFGLHLLATLPAGVKPIGYTLDAMTGRTHASQLRTLCPQTLRSSGAGVSFTLDGVEFAVPVVGRFNVSNVLAVTGVLLARGYALTDCARVLAQLVPPPGRMQTLGGEGVPLVVVDYAHTPDALEKALGVLAETARARSGQLHCVFGCGGDRDASKRPLMGAVAQRLADTVLVTSDNPRSENPQAILADIIVGMRPGARTEVERGTAINRVVADAQANDVILIAGKGHEPYQEIAGVRHPFSDLAVAQAALACWGNAP